MPAKVLILYFKTKCFFIFITLTIKLFAHIIKNTYFCTVIGLARHLEVLLLNNDCVAVPDFGGFVAHYVSARFDETDSMFLPPMRTIGFNPQLKMNDSLLAQSYVESFDISYPEALRRIEQDVDAIRNIILHEGQYLLEGIGTLTLNDEGNYSFQPYEAGLLTPSLYGLSSYEFNLLKTSSATMLKPAVIKEQDDYNIATEEKTDVQPSLIELIDDDDTDRAIHIKLSWVRNAVAFAAAIVLFFLMTTPVANSNLGSQAMSALHNSIVKKLMPKDTNIAPVTHVVSMKKVKDKPVAKQDTSKTASTKKSEPVIAKSYEHPYCIVLASQVKQSNAELFANKMRNRGFKDTEVFVYNGVVRVVYGHFDSENAAYIELHKLRFEEDFEEAWVYKRRIEG